MHGSSISRHRRLWWARGYTLVELTMSMAIIAVLLAAIGSALVIAAQALPENQHESRAIQEGRSALDQFLAELQYATSITEETATAITFTLADRGHGAGGPETARYAWSGVAGDPLTRQYNGGTADTIAKDVVAFSLTYYSTPDPNAPPPPAIEGSEQLFLAQDSTNSGTATAWYLQPTRIAEYFKPSLPANAVSWRITRVRFLCGQRGPVLGGITVQVRPAATLSMPGTTIQDEVQLPEPSSEGWREVSFTNAGGLNPLGGCHIVFGSYGDTTGNTGYVKYGSGSTGSSGTVAYFDSGTGTWTLDNTADVWIWVYGKVTTPDPDAPPPPGALDSVSAALQVGPDVSSRLQAEIQVLNRPTVTGS